MDSKPLRPDDDNADGGEHVKMAGRNESWSQSDPSDLSHAMAADGAMSQTAQANAGVSRRTFFATATSVGLLPSLAVLAELGAIAPADAQSDAPEVMEGFTADKVKKIAEGLASRAFVKPQISLPDPFAKLTYDQYRDIRFRTDHAIWRGDKLDHELQLFSVGYLYDTPVELWIVDQGRAQALKADATLFSIGPQIGDAPQSAPFGFSGFRVHGPVNRSDVFDEYVVFQGASYFRAVGRGNLYGVSARGLAVNTARPGGEEFPFFRSFYIEKPKPGAPEIIVHAVLDSPSCAGAYKFTISPRLSTDIDIEMTLFPRRDITYFGIAPLTSMFLHGPASQRVSGDFRPSVHDSEGLAMVTGAGERIWRPLTNPRQLQSSAFLDNNPKGFGLAQRDRTFANFEDLEAHYERRPSVWVEPKGAWGNGTVELFEIPVDQEIHDNIVAFWRPAKAIEVGKPVTLAYTMSFGTRLPAVWSGLSARKTRMGNGRKGMQLFVIDFDGPAMADLKELPVADVRANTGTVLNATVQRNAETGGLRATFELQTGGAEIVELRLVLKAAGQAVSESWLYRWTKP